MDIFDQAHTCLTDSSGGCWRSLALVVAGPYCGHGVNVPSFLAQRNVLCNVTVNKGYKGLLSPAVLVFFSFFFSLLTLGQGGPFPDAFFFHMPSHGSLSSVEHSAYPLPTLEAWFKPAQVKSSFHSCQAHHASAGLPVAARRTYCKEMNTCLLQLTSAESTEKSADLQFL